jgi:hypothetical protein
MSGIIKMAEARNEFACLEDGFCYYWPSQHGAISSYQLRQLADELDKRNKKWSEEIDEYFRNQQRSDSGSGVDGGQACGEDDFGDSATPVHRSSVT